MVGSDDLFEDVVKMRLLVPCGAVTGKDRVELAGDAARRLGEICPFHHQYPSPIGQ